MEKMKGFTLIELLIALALGSIVVAFIFNLFLTIGKTYDIQDQVGAMNQNARVSIDRLSQDIRNIVNINAGALVPSGIQIFPNKDIDNNSSNGIDLLRIVVYAPDSPKSVAGSTTSSGSNTTIPVNNITYFATNEYAVITDRSSTEVFKIYQVSSSPSQFITFQLLSKVYAAGSEVYKVKYLDYGLRLSDSSCNCPVLKRKDYKGGGAVTLTENIEDLNFTLSSNTVQITLVARTERQDANYGYRKRTLESHVKIRNMN